MSGDRPHDADGAERMRHRAAQFLRHPECMRHRERDEVADLHPVRWDRQADASQRRSGRVEDRGRDGTQPVGVFAIGDGVALLSRLPEARKELVEIGDGALGELDASDAWAVSTGRPSMAGICPQ